MKLLVVWISVLIFAGCSASAPVETSTKPEPPKTIQIVSEPAGARIEVDQDYVGNAPLEIKVPQRDGNFTRSTTIQATPTSAGQVVQSKYFNYSSPIPSRVLFTMDLLPVPQ